MSDKIQYYIVGAWVNSFVNYSEIRCVIHVKHA
jgi:hypothetical protein